MSDIIQLKTGSYKGVEILFVESSTTGGNRIIKFQYPGSDNQSVEYQGRAKRSFSMTIWIPHENYYTKKEEILRVLEDGTKGTFVHPTFGAIENVINGLFTITERNTELGRASISVVLEIDDGDGIPVEAGALAAQVKEEADLLNAQLNNDLADNYNVTPSFTGNFEDAVDNLGNLINSLEDTINSVSPAIDAAADFAQTIKNLSEDINSLVQAPTDLANRIGSILVSLDSYLDDPSDPTATGDPSEVANLFTGLFTFGDTDPIVNQTTAGRIERVANRDRMRANIRAQSLSYAYVNFAQVTYETIESLGEAQAILEAQYQDCRNNQLLTNEALEQLDRLRVQAQNTFNEKLVDTKSIITVDVSPVQPLTTLVYKYYGSTELVETIAELNNIEMNAFVEGDIKILAQ